MLILSDKKPLGKGRHRLCHAHPDDANKCIKTVHFWGAGGRAELDRELKYYRHLQKTLKDWSGIPRFFGEIETDIGTGYVYELIRSDNGETAKTMCSLMKECTTREEAERIFAALKQLLKYLADNHVCTMNMKPYNILFRKKADGTYRAVVCDNLGEATLIPPARTFNWANKQKLRRQWKRFLRLGDVRAFKEKYGL